MTLIMQASSFGDVEMVESLSRAEADPHKRGATNCIAAQRLERSHSGRRRAA